MKTLSALIDRLHYCWLIYWRQKLIEQMNDPYCSLDSITCRVERINEELQRI